MQVTAYVGGGIGTIQVTIPGSSVILLEQDIPLATLVAAGAVASASFNIGALMPAGARVFPDTAEIEVDTILGAGAMSMSGATAFVASTNPIPGSLHVGAPANLAVVGLYGGGPASNADVGSLCMTQGGFQLYCQATISGGPLFSQLTQGHIKARILYCTP